MRSVLIVGLACGLLGCSAAPTQWQPSLCNHDSGDCSPDAVRARVLEAFKDVKVQAVLACTDKASEVCYNSADVDHEACLVRTETPVAAVPYEKNNKMLWRPLLRALVGQDEPRYPLSIYREHQGQNAPVEESVYVYSAGNLAVLYLVEARCLDINEIT